MADQEKTPTVVLSIRMPTKLVDEVYRTAQRQNTTASVYVREALIRSLSSKDVKLTDQ